MNTLSEETQNRLEILLDFAMELWMEDTFDDTDPELNEMTFGVVNDLEGVNGVFDNWHIKHELHTFTYSGNFYVTTTLTIRYADGSGVSTLEIEYDESDISDIRFERVNASIIDDIEWMLIHSPQDFVKMTGKDRLANIYKMIGGVL